MTPTINRVCIRRADGTLKSARFYPYAEAGDEWVPVPADALTAEWLRAEDEARPTGVHPAVWYGWPKGETDDRDFWTLESASGQVAVVRAFSPKGALHNSGFREVARIERHARWY